MAFRLRRVLRTSLSLFTCFVVFSTLWMFAPQQSVAENFRIETKVFEGKSKTPFAETITIFSDGVVYDFLTSPAQTAIFSRPNGKNPGRFILLNDDRRVRTEISTSKLEGAMLSVRDWAGKQSDKFLKFSANPDFEESFEPGTGQLVLASHLESYTVETEQARHPKAASDYREFLDWYVQLNTLLSGSPIPPQPRLELNKALSRHKVIAKSVELTRLGRDEPLRAEHKFVWMLKNADMGRIDDANAALASYHDVSNEEYRKIWQDAAEADAK